MWRIVTRAARFASARLPWMRVESEWVAARVPALHQNGWTRSRYEKRSVALSGRPIPWITYPAIVFLSRRVRNDLTVFEYGCGASTLWWESRVRRIVSVEHDVEWARAIAQQAPANATVVHVPLQPEELYAREILAHGGGFDIVVIDGRNRVRCAAAAVGALAPDGVIVFDNSDRPQYEAAYQALTAQGFRKLEFVGLAPMIDFERETSVFYRAESYLGL